MTSWHHEQREYLQRRQDALDAGEMFLVLFCVLLAIACWHFFVEWLFGMFP